jgi:hypothetical protein
MCETTLIQSESEAVRLHHGHAEARWRDAGAADRVALVSETRNQKVASAYIVTRELGMKVF